MGETTAIAWTDHTFNPWIGCSKVCPECAHCYAEGYGQRFGVAWGERGNRRRTSPSNWHQPLRWHRAAVRDGVRRRVFCASLADVFEDRADLTPWRRDLFYLIGECHGLDWLLLTKRPEDVHRLGPAWHEWPRNAWLGTSAGTQATLDRAMPELLDTPGPPVTFLSAEPLLEPLCLDAYLDVDWVIVGGESGPQARPCSVEWVRSIVRQCKSAGVPVFVKQLGAAPYMPRLPEWHEHPGTWSCRISAHSGRFNIQLSDRAGADPAEWPEDLRVREWPREVKP